VDRRKNSCEQTATHEVNSFAPAVTQRSSKPPPADLLSQDSGKNRDRTGFRANPKHIRIAVPRWRQYYVASIGVYLCYVRDVDVAGSNPVIPTNDSIEPFPPPTHMVSII
jgi:hypothetical protein